MRFQPPCLNYPSVSCTWDRSYARYFDYPIASDSVLRITLSVFSVWQRKGGDTTSRLDSRNEKGRRRRMGREEEFDFQFPSRQLAKLPFHCVLSACVILSFPLVSRDFRAFLLSLPLGREPEISIGESRPILARYRYTPVSGRFIGCTWLKGVKASH